MTIIQQRAGSGRPGVLQNTSFSVTPMIAKAAAPAQDDQRTHSIWIQLYGWTIKAEKIEGDPVRFVRLAHQCRQATGGKPGDPRDILTLFIRIKKSYMLAQSVTVMPVEGRYV